MAIEIVESEDNMEEVAENLSVVVISQILLHSCHLLPEFPITVPLFLFCGVTVTSFRYVS